MKETTIAADLDADQSRTDSTFYPWSGAAFVCFVYFVVFPRHPSQTISRNINRPKDVNLIDTV